jgi:hypothetical protein
MVCRDPAKFIHRRAGRDSEKPLDGSAVLFHVRLEYRGFVVPGHG